MLAKIITEQMKKIKVFQISPRKGNVAIVLAGLHATYNARNSPRTQHKMPHACTHWCCLSFHSFPYVIFI